jgi:putative transposase
MTMPRPVIAGSTVMITRRCTQRQFLLLPTEKTTQIVSYVLGWAAERRGVLLHGVCVMSNHWHVVLTDVEGNLPAFMADFHRTVAKACNASLGRWENFWATEQPSVVRLGNPEDILDKLVYVLTNPVAAGLVAGGSEWRGLWAYRPEQSREVTRPSVYFRSDGSMPDSVSLRFVLPPALADQSVVAYSTAVSQRMGAKESEQKQYVRAGGRTFAGMKRVMAQHPTDTPDTPEPRRDISPRVAAKNKWRRMELLQRLKTFLQAYRQAYQKWRAGSRDVLFPPGTYALRIYAGACIAPT